MILFNFCLQALLVIVQMVIAVLQDPSVHIKKNVKKVKLGVPLKPSQREVHAGPVIQEVIVFKA